MKMLMSQSDLSTLSDIEQTELAEQETIIERGLETFVEVGAALMHIRESRLYRAEYATFEDYCQDRWGMVASRARQLIGAAQVAGNLESVTTGNGPASERQTRPLTSLEPDDQRLAWQLATETAPQDSNGNGKITANHVQTVVNALKEIRETGLYDPETGEVAPVSDAVKAVIARETTHWSPPADSPADLEHAMMETTDLEHQKNVPHVAHNSGENEWYTPPAIITIARATMGEIDLDPASSEIANRIVKADSFYTKWDNGLVQPWHGNVWMNPPYAQPLMTQFSDRLVQAVTQNEIEQACVLVNNATETQWFQQLLQICCAVCFIKSRVRFIDENGEASGAPLQGQALLYFGANGLKFEEEASVIGSVLYGPARR
jgi:hypothetical protein